MPDKPRRPAQAQSLIEYAIIAALIAVALIVLLMLLAGMLGDKFNAVSEALDAGATAVANGGASSDDSELSHTYSVASGDNVFAVYSEDDNSVRIYGSVVGDGTPQAGTKFRGRTVTAIDTDIAQLDELGDAKSAAKTFIVEDRVTFPSTSMHMWLMNWSALESASLAKLDTSNVVTMQVLLAKCPNLKTVDMVGIDTSAVTNMNGLFAYDSALESADLSYFVTALCTDPSAMFFNCASLKWVRAVGWDTSGATNMNGMFCGCESLTSIEGVSDFDMRSVETVNYMFQCCHVLSTLDISRWTTPVLSQCAYMFTHDLALTSLDLSSMNTTKVQWMQQMFRGCENLETIKVGGDWSVDFLLSINVDERMEDVFLNCYALRSATDGWAYDENKIDAEYAVKGTATEFGYLS